MSSGQGISYALALIFVSYRFDKQLFKLSIFGSCLGILIYLICRYTYNESSAAVIGSHFSLLTIVQMFLFLAQMISQFFPPFLGVPMLIYALRSNATPFISLFSYTRNVPLLCPILFSILFIIQACIGRGGTSILAGLSSRYFTATFPLVIGLVVCFGILANKNASAVRSLFMFSLSSVLGFAIVLSPYKISAASSNFGSSNVGNDISTMANSGGIKLVPLMVLPLDAVKLYQSRVEAMKCAFVSNGAKDHCFASWILYPSDIMPNSVKSYFANH